MEDENVNLSDQMREVALESSKNEVANRILICDVLCGGSCGK